MSQTQPNILEDYGLISMKVNLLNEELSKMNKQKSQEIEELAQISIDKDRLIEEQKKVEESYKIEEDKLEKIRSLVSQTTEERSGLLADVRKLKDECANLSTEKETLIQSVSALKKSEIEIEQHHHVVQSEIKKGQELFEKRKSALIQAIQNV